MSSAFASLLVPVRAIGARVLEFVEEWGRAVIFLWWGVAYIFTTRPQVAKTLRQIRFVGQQSIFVITLTGAFTGMVLGLQGYYALSQVGSEGSLGTLVSLSLIRELGPVLAAIMITARAGSAIAAEIGIMRISEQIDALHTMDINPIRFLFTPRLVACILSFPLLTALFDVVGIVGGYVTGSLLLGVNPAIYFYRAEYSVVMGDVTGGFYKALVFAVVVCTICCYKGYYVHLQEDGFGARGVSTATTSAVVLSCVMILVSDYVLTSLLM